jgi:hypothetical protein
MATTIDSEVFKLAIQAAAPSLGAHKYLQAAATTEQAAGVIVNAYFAILDAQQKIIKGGK